MTHVNDDVLAAIALDDPDVDPADRAHVDACPVCSEEVAELVQVRSLLREQVGMHGPHRVEPGPEVWERVLEATQDEDAAEPRPAVQPVEATVTAMADHRAPGTSQGRGRRTWWVAAAAAACLLLGVLVGRAVWAPGEATQPVLASVPLTTLDASKQQEGTAQLLGGQGGQGGQGQELRVETQPMSAGNGYVEVWLINTDGKRMVSLGVLSTTQGTFPIPPDAIAQGYTIVDLSREQFDDKPQHSGDSVMRGTLPV
jgi:hypothetical protein